MGIALFSPNQGSKNEYVQYTLMSILMTFCIFLQHKCQPFQDQNVNDAELHTLFVISFFYMGGQLLTAEDIGYNLNSQTYTGCHWLTIHVIALFLFIRIVFGLPKYQPPYIHREFGLVVLSIALIAGVTIFTVLFVRTIFIQSASTRYYHHFFQYAPSSRVDCVNITIFMYRGRLWTRVKSVKTSISSRLSGTPYSPGSLSLPSLNSSSCKLCLGSNI